MRGAVRFEEQARWCRPSRSGPEGLEDKIILLRSGGYGGPGSDLRQGQLTLHAGGSGSLCEEGTCGGIRECPAGQGSNGRYAETLAKRTPGAGDRRA